MHGMNVMTRNLLPVHPWQLAWLKAAALPHNRTAMVKSSKLPANLTLRGTNVPSRFRC